MPKFVCKHTGCSKAFNRRDYLERHAANHLPVKPYTCEPCRRSFARPDLYENHLATKFHLKRAGGKLSPSQATENANLTPPHSSPSEFFNAPKQAQAQSQNQAQPQLPPSPVSSPPMQVPLKSDSEGYFRSYQQPQQPQQSQLPQLPQQPQPGQELPGAPVLQPERTGSSSGSDVQAPSTISLPSLPSAYQWLFSESSLGLPTPGAESGYQAYSRLCAQAARNQHSGSTVRLRDPPALTCSSIVLSEAQCAQVSSVLSMQLTPSLASTYLDACWTFTHNVPQVFIHRPTFVANDADKHLVAAMILVGMHYYHMYSDASPSGAISPDSADLYGLAHTIRNCIGSSAYAASSSPSAGLQLLQAFTLLLWFELTNAIPNTPSSSPSRQSSGQWHLVSCARQVIEQTRLPAERPVQLGGTTRNDWLQWAQYESRLRCLHHMFITFFVSAPPQFEGCLTVLDLNVYMPCPEQYWTAQSSRTFFAAVQSLDNVQTVPFLTVVRSLLRLARLGEPLGGTAHGQWSRFALSSALYGLLDGAHHCADPGNRTRLCYALKRWKQCHDGDDSDKDGDKWPLVVWQYYQHAILLHEDLYMLDRLRQDLQREPHPQTIKLSEPIQRWLDTQRARELVDLAVKLLSSHVEATDRNALYYGALALWADSKVRPGRPDLIAFSCAVLQDSGLTTLLQAA